jgi:hypothetical protein
LMLLLLLQWLLVQRRARLRRRSAAGLQPRRRGAGLAVLQSSKLGSAGGQAQVGGWAGMCIVLAALGWGYRAGDSIQGRHAHYQMCAAVTDAALCCARTRMPCPLALILIHMCCATFACNTCACRRRQQQRRQ